MEAPIMPAPARRDLVNALPAELVQSCFRLLNFRERMSVSHVSRAWRVAALNDRSLWTEAGSPHTTWPRGPDMLIALLARSDPLPFSFSWECSFPENHLPADTADIVCRNMHRMQTLSVEDLSSDDSERLYRQPAPLLKHFSSQDSNGSRVLAGLWPRVEDLQIVSLVLPPAPQPFAAVCFFSCWDIGCFTDAGISLFSMFPALQTLRVWRITTEDLACLSEPPGAMAELLIGEECSFEVDYARFLHACRGLQVKRLHLHLAQQAAGVVELFSATARGPLRMDVDEHIAEMQEDKTESGPSAATPASHLPASLAFQRA